MDFVYSESQRMLAESLERLVQSEWTMPKRRAREAQARVDTNAWETLADMGVLGLTIAPEYEGFGEDPSTLVPVHLALGRGLVDEPVIPSAVMGAALIGAAGNDAQQAALLPGVAQGTVVLAVAYQEPNRRYHTRPMSMHATAAPDGYRLTGMKQQVWHGAAATHWLVSARTEEGRTALFVVPADTGQVRVRDVPTFDRSRCADIVFENVHVPHGALLVDGREADRVLATAIEWGIAALSLHAAGAMRRAIDLTAAYLKDRRQFGQPLAAFQALQHRLADMLVASEMALSMAYVAVAALSETDASRRAKMISQAKIETARAGRFIGEQAIQLHGGMGMTDEMEIGDYFKRLTAVELLLGDTSEHFRILETLA